DPQDDPAEHEGQENGGRETEQPAILVHVLVLMHRTHSDSPPLKRDAIRAACRRTSWSSAVRRASGFGLGSRAALRRPVSIESRLPGSTSTPVPGVTSSGGPPIRVATTGRSPASASSTV